MSKNEGKVIDKEYLEKQFKNYDKYKFYNLVAEVPSHYEKSSSDNNKALEIVADDTENITEKQILLKNVTPVLPTTYEPQVGDYVILIDKVDEHYEEKYVKKEDIPEGSTTMTTDEFNNMWGEVVVLDYQES